MDKGPNCASLVDQPFDKVATNEPPRPRDQNSFTSQFHQHSSLTTEFAAPYAGRIQLVSRTLSPEEINALGQRIAEHKPRSRRLP
jgi:hypothetical protein